MSNEYFRAYSFFTGKFSTNRMVGGIPEVESKAIQKRIDARKLARKLIQKNRSKFLRKRKIFQWHLKRLKHPLFLKKWKLSWSKAMLGYMKYRKNH